MRRRQQGRFGHPRPADDDAGGHGPRFGAIDGGHRREDLPAAAARRAAAGRAGARAGTAAPGAGPAAAWEARADRELEELPAARRGVAGQAAARGPAAARAPRARAARSPALAVAAGWAAVRA